MDEKQLQFLYNEYAKNKGFKDYSEFKGLMSSEGSRKLFFDDANTELGFKDYNEFNDLLGLKKKDGGQISSPTELPSVSREYLDKGQELADGSFLKKIGELDRSQLVSQYKSPDISLTQKPKKDYYSTKLEKGLIFDKEGQLYAPSSEALSKDITAAEQASLKKSTQKDLVEKSREMPVVVEPTEPTEEQGLLLNLVSSLDRGFAKNFISNPMKGLGTFLQGTTKKVLGGSGEGAISDALIKYGDYLNNAIEELTPQDQEYKDSLWDQAAQALGQVGSLVLTGGLTGAAGKGAALVAQAPKGAVATAASRIASQLSAPTSISAGLSMGQAEFDRAKQAGATDDQAFEAFYKNAVTGSVLETIPVMQFFKRFNKATAGGFVNYLKTKGVAGFTGGVEEMTTEILQQLYANKTAKDIYNINQSILDGVGTSGGIGFGVGFLLNAMGANARILRKQGKTQDAIAIENQIEQYEDNLKNPKVTSGNTAKDIVTQGVEIGTQKAVQDLDRDLANNVITPKKYQEEIAFAEKAAQVADKIPETVTGESRVKSVELLVERNDIKQANDNLIQQKQSTDEAYHAGIDEEIKANEEKIKEIDAKVYDIAKKPSKDFGDKKYVVDGEEVSKEAFDALQGKPIGTKSITYIEATGDDVQDVQLKGKEYKSEVISPDEYLKETGGYESTFIDQKKVDKIKEKIKNGTPLDPLTLTTKEGSNVGQEGRHRAEAAKQLGIKEIPVVRIEGELPNVKEEVKPTEVKEEVKVEMVKPEVKKGKLEAYKAKYAPKPKEKIEPIKIEDNGKPIIAKDPAENDIAIAKLAKQDNPVEEPSIKAIEGKAEGDIKAKLNEVIAEVDDKIKLATRIEMVAMNDLKTDEASFQNREGLNLKKVDDIVANYNPSEFDPIIYWTDANGQKYTLNHHRFAAAQKLKLDEIPAQKLTYPLGHPKEFQVVPATDKAEAIDFAINRSNANRSMETAVERAKALRKLQKTGTKEEINKFLEREGKNKTKIQNIAALNENGKTIDALKMFGDAEDVQLQKETEQRSDWIGEARRRISGLTNEHENEMFDFLMDKDASKRITSKADFISKVTSLAGGFDFNPENPLNLKRFKYQTEGERAYDERTGQLKSEIDTRQTKIDDLKARFSDPSRKDYIPTDSRDYEQTKKIADDQISKLNTEIKSFQQKLQEHYKEKGKYQGGIEQGGLFATKQITTEEISDMADIVKEFYDEGVIKLDDIKKEIAKELGYNSKALKDAVEQAYNKMVMEYTPVEISKGVIGKVGEKLNELGEDGVVMLEDDQSIFAKATQLAEQGGRVEFQYGKERIDSLINNIKINGQDISELLNYVVDSNDLLRRLDYLNKGINRNIELSKAIKDEKLSNPLKELRIGLLKYMDSEIEYRNNELKNAKQKGVLNKDGDISDLKSRKIASYEKRLEKLKFYKDFIDNNLFNIKDLEINFKNIQYGKENLAPNGKKSNLTPEQYVLVRTPNFKKWFGDWENDPENASKVIDENGEPLVVYHGSIAPDIEVFDRELSKRKPSGLREMGFYFTTNKELAEFYSTAPAKEGAKNIKSKVYQSFLNLKTVKEFDAKGKNGLRAWDQLQVDAGYKIAQNRDAMDFLQNGKFGVDKVDGIIARNISDMESYGAVGVNEKFNGTVFLVFDDNKNSIKSATDNTGAFSTTDDRINYMAKPSGDILGFTYGKTIYLNASKINPNTPIHEGGHIWTRWVKNNDPRLYDRGMELVKNSKYLERAKSSKFYQEQAAKLPQGEREAYFQEEALAMAIGDKGAQFVAEAKKSSFKEWLDNLWDAIKNAAGFDNITAKELQNLTFDEFVKRAARDILSPKSQQELASINEGMAEAYKDLTINQKRQIINSKFDELLRVLKIEKICP